jgi:hypothetical protein
LGKTGVLSSVILNINLYRNDKGDDGVAFAGSKGWYIKKLRGAGITKHPIDKKKLELHKTFVIKKIYENHLKTKH